VETPHFSVERMSYNGRVSLLLSELLTRKVNECDVSLEDLRSYKQVSPEELTPKEKNAVDAQAKLYAKMCQVFSELVQDPNAGKGPEHFCGDYDG